VLRLPAGKLAPTGQPHLVSESARVRARKRRLNRYLLIESTSQNHSPNGREHRKRKSKGKGQKAKGKYVGLAPAVHPDLPFLPYQVRAQVALLTFAF